jgi:hypothetical protein
MAIVPVPVGEETVAQYAAYLARRLSPSSVRQYINIIRILHLECGLEHPYLDSWVVKTTLMGIDKTKGCEPNRKAPITPELLLRLKARLDLHTVRDKLFWAACLVLFYGLLRRSNLFQESGDFDPEKQLTRDCVNMSAADRVTLVIKWSKTIQRKERQLEINLPAMPGHPLCPFQALSDMLSALGTAAPKTQAFPIKGSEFNKRLRRLLSSIVLRMVTFPVIAFAVEARRLHSAVACQVKL